MMKGGTRKSGRGRPPVEEGTHNAEAGTSAPVNRDILYVRPSQAANPRTGHVHTRTIEFPFPVSQQQWSLKEASWVESMSYNFLTTTSTTSRIFLTLHHSSTCELPSWSRTNQQHYSSSSGHWDWRHPRLPTC